MKRALIAMSPATKNCIFGGLYVVCILLAICPPLYLWASDHGGTVLGLPFAVAYILFDALLLTATVAALYYVENVRGEVE